LGQPFSFFPWHSYTILIHSALKAYRILIPSLRQHHTHLHRRPTINPKIKEIIMTNTSQIPTANPGTNEHSAADKAAKLNAKIKETWSKLSDDDIKLYASNRGQFFSKLKEKQDVSQQDAEKQLKEIETSCASSCGTKKPAKAA
jgi:hypothetical protein